jgi:2-iminobutanoate/2-iminopropanoate deaminase
MRVQVRKVLENIRGVLGTMDRQMSDIVSLVHHAVDIEQFMMTGDIC